MRFIDEAQISVKAGHGGPGSVSFRREKFVPNGGPDGGNGGRGGHIWIVASKRLNTLQDLRYQHVYKADNGQQGMKNQKDGKAGEDLTIRVPVGTLVKKISPHNEVLLYDLQNDEEKICLVKGGRGGLGNMNFATSTNQAPRHAQPGEPGEELDLKLELKLMADVGLIGYPNAGKSTLISRMSAARPKIADYPFTTLIPNLGVVSIDENRSFVVADIPGLLEGAHTGVGLGLQFLRHIERTKILVHVIDGSKKLSDPNWSPLEDFQIINSELEKFDPGLLEKHQIVALNKIDVLPEEERKELTSEIATLQRPYLLLSGVSGEGVKNLADELAKVIWSEASE